MNRIGRYQIESPIGRGAMGVVYLATDPRLRRPVAVKSYSVPRGFSETEAEEFRERFLREARAAAALSHPGIVTVYDADEDPERNLPYIAMEYVEGRSLQQLLAAEGPLSLEHAVAIVGALADALQAAHDNGIVHRDVKPANVLIRASDGTVKIADFGVAKLVSSTLTRSGDSIGSPAYMSPEQVRGREIDGRSDLFSLAIILYEMLCGTRPFGGDDPTEVLYSVAHETPVPLTKRRSDLPAALERFLDRALAKDPAARFADGPAFKKALEEAARAPREEDVEATLRSTAGLVASSRSSVPSSSQATDGTVPSDRGRPFGWRRALLAAAMLLMVAAGGWTIVRGKKTYVRFDVSSGVKSGQLMLLVDGAEVYRRELSVPEDKQGFLKKMRKQNRETFEAWIEVEPGEHEIAARILPDQGQDSYERAILVDLKRGEHRTLKLSANRIFGSSLSLKSD